MSTLDVRRGRWLGRTVALAVLAGFLGFVAAPVASPGGPVDGGGTIAPARWQVAEPTVIRRHVSTQPAQPGLERATASCQPGEQLVSGGYQLIQAEKVMSSFPSLANGEPAPDAAVVDSWTVEVRPVEKPVGKDPAAEVYVACVADPQWLSRSYLTSQTFGKSVTETQVSCPRGERLTGGGFRTTEDPGKTSDQTVVASLPDSALARWSVFGLMRESDGGFLPMPEFTYAVCASRSGLDTTVVRGPALVLPPDPAPFCYELFATPVCDLHRVGQMFLTCPNGVLVAGATAPFTVDPNGRFDSNGWDSFSTVTMSLPGQPFDSSDASGWSLTLEQRRPAVPADDPAIKADTQYPTLAVCASVVEPTPDVGVVNPPGPETIPPNRDLAAQVRSLLPWAVLGLLLVVLAALALRSVRRRARRGRPAPAAPAALVTIAPATPTDVIRMAGPHIAVSALLLPGTASHTWTERTSP
ncbi:MAG: hypothetical protein ACM30G_17895 [Micromonosporaceae bacterium]